MVQANSLDSISAPFISLPHLPQPLLLLGKGSLELLPIGQRSEHWYEFLTALEVGNATPHCSCVA